MDVDDHSDGADDSRRDSRACAFCGASSVYWHLLDTTVAGWRARGDKGMTWSDRIDTCQRCEDLYERGDYTALAALAMAAEHFGEGETLVDRLVSVAAFCRADRGVHVSDAT